MNKPQIAGQSLSTRRLVLRPLTVHDAERVAELAGDWDVARMTGQIPYPYTVDLAVDWIATFEEDEKAFAITLDRELIGVCGYRPMEGEVAELGYWIGKPYWGKGYATEAAAAIIVHCFEIVKVKTMTCAHFADNVVSARVIKKLGFSPTGKEACWCEARRRDVDAMSYELERPSTNWLRRFATTSLRKPTRSNHEVS